MNLGYDSGICFSLIFLYLFACVHVYLCLGVRAMLKMRVREVARVIPNAEDENVNV